MAKDLYKEILNYVPNHYDLLGLKLFENNPETIQKAAIIQSGKVREWELVIDRETADNVMVLRRSINLAIAELQDDSKKKSYDKELKEKLGLGEEKVSLPPLPNSLVDSEQESHTDSFEMNVSKFVLQQPTISSLKKSSWGKWLPWISAALFMFLICFFLFQPHRITTKKRPISPIARVASSRQPRKNITSRSFSKLDGDSFRKPVKDFHKNPLITADQFSAQKKLDEVVVAFTESLDFAKAEKKLTLALEENKTAPMKKDARDLLSAVEKVLNKARSIKKKEREEREWIVEEKERCDKYFKCLSREARELLERKYSMKKIATLCHLEWPLSKTKLLTKKALAEIKCKVNRFVDSKLPILSRLSLKNEAVNRFPIWKSRNVVSFTDKRGHTLNGKLYDVKPNYVWVGLDKVKYRDIPKSVKIHIYKNENTERIRQYIEEGKKNRIMARNKLRTRLLKLAIDDSCKKAGYIKFCGSWHTNKQMADILTNKRKLLIEKLFKKKFVELLRAKSFMEDPSSPNGWSSKALLDFKHKIELRNAKINSELQNACNTYDFEKLKRICREYPGTIYEKKARKYVMIKLVKNRATFPKTRKTLQKPQSNTQKGKRGEPPLFHQLLILPRKNFRIHFSD